MKAVDLVTLWNMFVIVFLTVTQWVSAVSDAMTSLRICLPREGNIILFQVDFICLAAVQLDKMTYRCTYIVIKT